MKKNIFITIPICTIIFCFLMVSFSFSAPKSTKSVSSYSTKPFDDSWKSLPPKYNGHDIVAVHKILSKRFSEKGEFETTEQFNQRNSNAWDKPVIGNITGRDKFAFVLENIEKKYDADKSEYILEIEPFQYEGIILKDFRVGDDEFTEEIVKSHTKTERRKSIMRGKDPLMNDIAGSLVTGMIKEAGIRDIYSLRMPDNALPTVKQIAVDMSPDEARQAKDNIRALFVCYIRKIGKSTAKNRIVSYYSNPLEVNLEKTIIFNYQSGKIYRIVYTTSFYNNRGRANIELGKYNEGFADLDKAIEVDPKNDVAYNNRGYAYNKLGKYNEAIAELNKAIELDPNYNMSYNNRGHAYIELGKYNEAIADLNKAIALDPKSSAGYGWRGYAYNKLGKYNEAIADLDKEITLDPKSSAAYYDRGYAYNGLGKYNEAIVDSNKAIELNPQYAEAYYSRACSYSMKGNTENAIQDLDKAVKLKPALKNDAKTDKDFDNIKNKPEFKKLVGE